MMWRRINATSAIVTVLATVATAGVIRADAGKKDVPLRLPATGLDERAKALHALNRLAYGPRPGEVERIAEKGVAAYVERQLDPAGIDDSELDRRLASLPTLRMTPVELVVAYPPTSLLRSLSQRLEDDLGMDPGLVGGLLPEARPSRRTASASGDEGSMASGGPARRAPTSEESMEQLRFRPRRVESELARAKLVRAVHGERQLHEVMTDFWFNHFNVFVAKGASRWWTTSFEYDAIRPHALGRFRDLLGAVARHPAMLFYLDNWRSVGRDADVDPAAIRLYGVAMVDQLGLPPGGIGTLVLRDRGLDTTEFERDALRRRELLRRRVAWHRAGRSGARMTARENLRILGRGGLNENFARELLELHTLGVDGGYTQRDVVEVARCFTGWTLAPVEAGYGFVFVSELHEAGAKTVLGQRIKARGVREGEKVLDLLARHPSTAKFVSTKLARRFVADDPPPALVDRMARTFRESRGDIRRVLRTMLESSEFWSPEAVGAKVKTPFEFLASAARATAAEVAGSDSLEKPGPSVSSPMTGVPRARGRAPGALDVLRALGQPPYRILPPTGFGDTAADWVSAGALIGRMRTAMAIAFDRVPDIRTGVPEELAGIESAEDLLRAMALRLNGEPLPDAAVESMARRLGPGSGVSRRVRPRLAMGWILASPGFQRR